MPRPPMTDALAAACKVTMFVVTPAGDWLRAEVASLYILRALGFRWVRPFEYRPLRWLAALGYFFVARNRILVSKVLFKNEDGSSVF